MFGPLLDPDCADIQFINEVSLIEHSSLEFNSLCAFEFVDKFTIFYSLYNPEVHNPSGLLEIYMSFPCNPSAGFNIQVFIP